MASARDATADETGGARGQVRGVTLPRALLPAALTLRLAVRLLPLRPRLVDGRLVFLGAPALPRRRRVERAGLGVGGRGGKARGLKLGLED